VTRRPLSRSKGQRSRSPGRFTRRGVNASGSCSGERGNVLAMGTYYYVAVGTLQARLARRREALRRPQREEKGEGSFGAIYYFSLPRRRCSRLRSDVHDRQTDVRQHHRLMFPPIRGGGIIRNSNVFK